MNKQDISDTMAAIREAVRDALHHVGIDMIRSAEFFGTNQTSTKEGKE
jgi:hypothetical protein